MKNTWRISPATLIDYREDQPSDYPVIQTVSDIHKIILGKFTDRIRYREKDDRAHIVPVVFANENDRLKTSKSSPGIIISLGNFTEVPDASRVDQDYVPLLQENMIYVNEAPVMYKSTIGITCIADEFDLFTRLVVFIKDVIFPRRYGDRYITLSINPDNRRSVTIESESFQQDFDSNDFQFDLELSYQVGVYVGEWQPEFPVDVLQLQDLPSLKSWDIVITSN